MKSIKKILLFVDLHSDVPQVAVDSAIGLAKRTGAHLDVCDGVEFDTHLLNSSVVARDAVEAYVREKETKLAAILDRVANEGVGCTTSVLRGSLGAELVRRVLERKHDLVIKTMMPERGRASYFGGIGRFLLRKCPVPVWLVKPGFESAKQVVVAYAPLGEAMDDGAPLSTELVSWAEMIAEPNGSRRISLVHAYEFAGEAILAKRMPREEYFKYVDHGAVEAREAVTERASKLPDTGWRRDLEVLGGTADSVIPEYARASHADLLVVGSVARRGLRGILLGNTAEQITNSPPCSILVVKPPDFVSPVRL